MGEWKSLKIDSGTGWKEIYREAGTGWKALDWEGVPIDVGGACTNRGSYQHLVGFTYIDMNNAANANGTLTNICTYVNTTGSNDWHVGIFYLVSGTTYKCRSAANIGAQSVGSNNNVVSLAIQAGDFIGVYGPAGEYVEKTSAGNGHYAKSGNYCVVDSEEVYVLYGNVTFSVYGTG